jgi:hypothetical protein
MVLSVVDVLGFFDVSRNRIEELVLFAAGVFLLAHAVDAGERRRLLAEQEKLQHAMRAVSGAASVRDVAPNRIRSEINTLLAESDEWLFRGGSGRFLRFGSLPALARFQALDVSVLVQLLDPRDGELCTEYAKYRSVQRLPRALRPEEGKMRTIQADLLATIYAAAWYQAHSRIRPRVILLRAFSPLRYDFGSTGVVVTIADLTQPALYAPANSWYYQSVRDELEQAEHGHPSVLLPETRQWFPPRIDQVDAGAVRGALLDTRVEDRGSRSPLLEGDAAEGSLDFDLLVEAVTTPPPWI